MHTKQNCCNTLTIPTLIASKNSHFEQDHDESISTITEIGDSENWTMNRSNNSNILDMFASYRYAINNERSQSLTHSGHLVKQLTMGCFKLLEQDFCCQQTAKQQLRKSLCPLIINQNSHCFIESQKIEPKIHIQKLKAQFDQFKASIKKELNSFRNILNVNFIVKMKQCLNKVCTQINSEETNKNKMKDAYKQLQNKLISCNEQINQKNQQLKLQQIEINRKNQIIQQKTIQIQNREQLIELQRQKIKKLERKLSQTSQIQDLSKSLKKMIEYSQNLDKSLSSSLLHTYNLSTAQISTFLKKNNLIKKRICHIFKEITNEQFSSKFVNISQISKAYSSQSKNLHFTKTTNQSFTFRPGKECHILINESIRKNRTVENQSSIMNRLNIQPQISRLQRPTNSSINSKMTVDRSSLFINYQSSVKNDSKQKCQQYLFGIKKKIDCLKRDILNNMVSTS